MKMNTIDFDIEKEYIQDIINLIPYIVVDSRKAKFLKYSKSEEFYSLSYDRMTKAF